MIILHIFMSVHVVPLESIRRDWINWDWSYQWLLGNMWMLEIKSRFISLAPLSFLSIQGLTM